MSKLEWLLAFRMISASRRQAGVTVISFLSVIGIALSVAALIVTLSVREGFRADFVNTLLGSNPHITIQSSERSVEDGRILEVFEEGAIVLSDWDAIPVIRGQVVARGAGQSGVDVFGVRPEDMEFYSLDPFEQEGIFVGTELAKTLGVSEGDMLSLISPDGVKTPFGTSPRVSQFKVARVVSSGRFDVDRSRIYMPFDEAQEFFNRVGLVDAYHVFVEDVERVEASLDALVPLMPPGVILWTWKDTAGSFLRALELEDRVMFILLSALVSIAATTILAGLFILARNKRASIGILRTLGLSRYGVGRVFFICGMVLGVIGTGLGVALGAWMALNVDTLLMIAGGEWDPSVRGIYSLPVMLTPDIFIRAIMMAMGLSMLATIIPAIQAARMAPVEALDG